MIAERLKALKNKQKLTTAQIAEISGISESTITRILAGNGENANFQTMVAIVTAMNGSLDEIAGISVKPPIDDELLIADRAQASVTKVMESEVVNMYKSILANKDTWLKRLFVVLCVLVAILCTQWIVDVFVPTMGWVRY